MSTATRTQSDLESAAEEHQRSSRSGEEDPRKEKKKKRQQNPDRITRLCRFIKHLFTPPHPHSAPSLSALARPILEEGEEEVLSSFITLSLLFINSSVFITEKQ